MVFTLAPVGVVRSTRTEAEDDQWDSENSSIEMLPPFGDRALLGLADFSHCIVVYVFDRGSWDESSMARHPRGNTDWPEVGIFAQRARDRPNRLGVTVCQILEVRIQRFASLVLMRLMELQSWTSSHGWLSLDRAVRWCSPRGQSN